jgi:tetratricopeptide (TPR) repeat protein
VSLIRNIAVTLALALCWVTPPRPLLAQQERTSPDWKAELAKARAHIRTTPRSSFWHNQAGIAYYALGAFDDAVQELKLACRLDPSNPGNYYTLYGFYKNKGMHSAKRKVLLDALERDPNNPMGRFEFASILEEEKHWDDALREYRVAKQLALAVKGSAYIDARGGNYDVRSIPGLADEAIARVSKLEKSAVATSGAR